MYDTIAYMQKYMSLRVHTALYLSVFLIGLHHVFVYFANASILEYFFKLSATQIIFVYGIASVFGIGIFILLSRFKADTTKKQLHTATIAEGICLLTLYIATQIHLPAQTTLIIYTLAFCVHHLLTPYILYCLDTLFEAYTHLEDRGKGRGIYLTMWNIPFVVVPLLLSTLSMESLPLVYLTSFSVLIPFLIITTIYLQNPSPSEALSVPYKTPQGFIYKLKLFWADRLDRGSFITQSIMHLYYGVTGVLLPIYLYQRFGFDWSKIGLMLAITMAPYILTQIPFGDIEDKKHNEKFFFYLGILVTVTCTVLALLVSPTTSVDKSFLLISFFLFFARVGCSLIEISTESMFYKHINEQSSFAILMFRAGRLVPYALGLFAAFWI